MLRGRRSQRSSSSVSLGLSAGELDALSALGVGDPATVLSAGGSTSAEVSAVDLGSSPPRLVLSAPSLAPGYGEVHVTSSRGLVHMTGELVLTSSGAGFFPDSVELSQRREFVRAPLSLEVDVVLPDGVTVSGMSVNVSAGGAKLRCEEVSLFSPGSFVTCVLYLDEGRSVSLRARVAICLPPSYVTLEFLDVPARHEDLLCRLVFARLSELVPR